MLLARMVVIGACGAAAMVASEATTTAQSSPRRQATPGQTDRLLAATIFGGGGYDANVADSDPQPSFNVADLGAGLFYTARGSWFDVSASGGSTAQRYSQVLSKYTASHTAAFDATLRLDRRTSVKTSLTGALRPYYLLDAFARPAAGLPPFFSMGSAVPWGREAVFSGTADVTRTLSRRVTVSGTSEYRYWNVSGASLDVRSADAGGRLTFSAGPRTGLHAGYRYEQGSYGAGASRTLEIHHIDTGVDHRRELSAVRRAFIGGSTGAAIVDDGVRRHFRLTGDLTFTKDIGRTWHADARYERQVGFLLALPGPTASDIVTLGAGGRLTRRLNFQTTAAYTNGNVGLTGGTGGFDLYTFTASVTRPINRFVSTTVEGFHYHYSFAASAGLPQGWPRQLDRPGVRAQMTIWLPLLERVRRGHAAR